MPYHTLSWPAIPQYAQPDTPSVRSVEVDREGPVPVYRQVVDELLRRIRSGKLAANRPVPSATALVQEFGIARNTAIKVLRTLADEGHVVIVPGKGTFVSDTDR
jgi:GntR family transcriptional regulator